MRSMETTKSNLLRADLRVQCPDTTAVRSMYTTFRVCTEEDGCRRAQMPSRTPYPLHEKLHLREIRRLLLFALLLHT
jgi:hypothetical protein